MAPTACDIIEAKRDARELDDDSIGAFVDGFTRGEIPDYQASAFAMAVYFQGMTTRETAALTRAMVASGTTLTHPAGSPPKVDKHSTGGIGDKVSLVLAPLLASAGAWVPMISGRGLGITGGTLDKLESIPGFRTALTLEEARVQLARIGVAMMGQTDDLCPADRRLYALRDVTATVPSRPLIVSSIMSKKIAEGLDRLVLDVKFGSGAFMRTRRDAEALAADLAAVADEVGLESHVRLTPMDEPLGRAVGNVLEVHEAVELLRGGGPPDTRALVLDLAESVAPVARSELEGLLADGSAWRRFRELVAAQGGDPDAAGRLGIDLGIAPLVRPIPAPQSGTVTRLDAGLIGRASVALGAGRRRATDTIDPTVGFDRLVKVGETVAAGEPVCRVHARRETDAEAAAEAVLAALTIDA